jgi:transposase-like protein
MDALEWLRKHLDAEGSDLLREMVRTCAERLMGAEVEVLCNAGYGEVTPERMNSRNGYRSRQLDTRVGSIDLSIPKLREGSYYPGWLLEPRRRAERALVAVVAECYGRGVSTRRVEGLVQTLGIEHLSKSQVSRMAAELYVEVAAFCSRPLDGGPYTYVSLGAMTQKVRERGRIVNVAVVIAVGVNAEGHREVLGFDVIITEDGAGWLAFLRGLIARGVAGTTLVISDAHVGLVDGVRSTLTGATWQRCRTHFMPNLLTRVPKSAQAMVATLVRTIFAPPDAASVWDQHARVVVQLTERFPAAAELLAEAAPDVLAFTALPKEHWKQIWSTTPKSGSTRNSPPHRRPRHLPRDAVIRLVGSVLAEQHDEWAVVRRYMSFESLAKARLRVIDCEAEEVTEQDLAEVS